MAAFTEFAAAVWESFILRISNITVKDVVDIAIVSVLIYYFIRFIRDRRAGKLALGVAVLVLFQGLSLLFSSPPCVSCSRTYFRWASSPSSSSSSRSCAPCSSAWAANR